MGTIYRVLVVSTKEGENGICVEMEVAKFVMEGSH